MTNFKLKVKVHKISILSKSKGEATRLEGLGANNLLCTELPRPYATLKFEEDTKITTTGKYHNFMTSQHQTDILQVIKNAYQKDERPDLRGIDLSGANLSFVNLRRADLSGANLTGADLVGADLSFTNLSGVNLSEANMVKATLTWVNLTDAYLSGADLFRAELIWANLVNADFSEAHLLEANLRAAKYNLNTIWPENFDPTQTNAVLVD